MDGKSFDVVADNVRKIQALFPEAVTEVADENGNLTHKIDMEKLNILLGEEVIPSDDAEYAEKYGEKYSFEWFGKKRAIQESLKRSTGTLRPSKEDSVNWDTTENLYIEGDNLEVLKLLQDSYMGAVKMIYIDPPYNTGKDFVYKDNYKDNLQNYLDQTNTTNEVNTEASGRYHSNWLNMMYPRLKLARNLLTEDGVIFISIDDNEMDNLRKVCDEIFGEENFFACVSWHKNYASANDAKKFSNVLDYVLVYQKSYLFNRNLLPRTGKQNDLYKYDSNDGKGLWRSDNLSVKTYSSSYDYQIFNPNTGVAYTPPNGRCWMTNYETIQKWIEEGRIFFGQKGDGAPQLKRYLNEVQQGVVPITYWSYDECGHNDEARKEIKLLFDKPPFDTPKPTRLLTQILRISCSKDSLILDFFSGSATTAHAVMQLNAEDGGNRKFICVQLPEETPIESEARKAGYTNIPEIAKERIRRAGKKILEELKAKNDGLFKEDTPKLDIGFKVFKLDRSNVNAWDLELEVKNEKEAAVQLKANFESNVNILREGRTDLDLLYEVMLKKGLELTASVEEHVIDGKRVFVVGNGVMVASFEKELTYRHVAAMAELRPDFIIPGEFKVVIADESFTSSNDKTNALQLLKQKGISNFEII